VLGIACDESLAESLQKAESLEKNYMALGYEIIHIPSATVEEKTKII
jgi:predicted ATPase